MQSNPAGQVRGVSPDASTRSALASHRIDAGVMVIPGLALYAALVIAPIFQTVLLSFQDWDGISASRNFIGLQNYLAVLQSARFWRAFGNNVLWAALSVLPLVLGLVLAAILVQGRIWGSTFFRICFVLPFTLSQVIVAVIWGWIYQPDWGTVNTLLRGAGLDELARSWLSDPATALTAMNLVGSWTWFGFCMVIFMAGLQSIPTEIYDAADVDGANSVQKFFYLTVPILRPQIRMLSIVTLIFSFKVFDLVFVMTKGGPFQSSEVLGLLIYLQGFSLYKVGYASATAVVLTILVFIISLVVYWRTGKAS